MISTGEQVIFDFSQRIPVCSGHSSLAVIYCTRVLVFRVYRLDEEDT